MVFGIAHDLPTLPKIAHHHAGGCLNTPLQMPIHHVCMALQMPIQMGALPYTRAVPTVSPCRVMVDVVTNLPRLVGVGKSGDVVAIMRLTCWLLH